MPVEGFCLSLKNNSTCHGYTTSGALRIYHPNGGSYVLLPESEGRDLFVIQDKAREDRYE